MDDLEIDVSRETLDALLKYKDELLRWSARINLVSKSTAENAWARHIVDSAQLFKWHKPTDQKWADIGSGGGLPGLVLAIIAKELAPRLQIALVESDQRKSAFLRHITASFGLSCNVATQRVEKMDPLNVNVITARAFAPLPKLISLAQSHLKPEGRMILPKGKTAEEEMKEALKHWDFDVVTEASLTDTDSLILEIKNIKPKP